MTICGHSSTSISVGPSIIIVKRGSILLFLDEPNYKPFNKDKVSRPKIILLWLGLGARFRLFIIISAHIYFNPRLKEHSGQTFIKDTSK